MTSVKGEKKVSNYSLQLGKMCRGKRFWFPYFPAGGEWHDTVTAASGNVAVRSAQQIECPKSGGIRDLGARFGFAPAILERRKARRARYCTRFGTLSGFLLFL